MTRDTTRDRGLTRIEVTCYTDGNKLDYDVGTMSAHIADVSKLLSTELIYSTPHSAMWNAYCDCFKHTLIVVNGQAGAAAEHVSDKKKIMPGRVLVVYSFNNITKDLSGRFVDTWNEISKHAIDHHTLSATLPIKIIEVCKLQKAYSNQHNGVEVHIISNTYQKSHDKPLSLTASYTIFNRKSYTPSDSNYLLTKAGFVPHINCSLTLPLKQSNKRSKAES